LGRRRPQPRDDWLPAGGNCVRDTSMYRVRRRQQRGNSAGTCATWRETAPPESSRHNRTVFDPPIATATASVVSNFDRCRRRRSVRLQRRFRELRKCGGGVRCGAARFCGQDAFLGEGCACWEHMFVLADRCEYATTYGADCVFCCVCDVKYSLLGYTEYGLIVTQNFAGCCNRRAR
jgi:hypothetical protein